MQTRYHIQLNNRRTTITLDTILSELLAVKLGATPGADNAHGIIREWLQATITESLGGNLPTGARLSQWARRFAIEYIADIELMNRVTSYRIE